MADKTKKKANRTAKSNDDDSVVRIKAGSSASHKSAMPVATPVEKTPSIQKTAEKQKKSGRKIRGTGPLRSFGGYFIGAWKELRQVRWPNRRATWSLTGAVLAYSAFFVLLVLLLDTGFNYLFELILGT